ncbi:MAG: hypothetical protein QGI45_12450 [Myxococcota bacterium]|jgi:hypothetical protein|nr:hypothetical protein [Myxococcota bacterium]
MAIVFRWDLDKTYLKTEFSRVQDLIRTFFQKAEDKEVFAGATTLIHALDAIPESKTTFISGSPRPMRKVLKKKLELDGIHVDALVLKPNFSNFLRGRFRALKEQVGYKLPALLEQRLKISSAHTEICFGDDAEVDAFIYSLYGDVVAGKIEPQRLKRLMQKVGAYEDQIDHALELYVPLRQRQEEKNPVERIFIHLEGRSGPQRYAAYGVRVVPIYNYFQAGLMLYSMQHLHMDDLLKLTQTVLAHPRLNEKRLANSAQDLVRRHHLALNVIDECLQGARTLGDKELVECFERASRRTRELDKEELQKAPDEVQTIDYEKILEMRLLGRRHSKDR